MIILLIADSFDGRMGISRGGLWDSNSAFLLISSEILNMLIGDSLSGDLHGLFIAFE